MAAAGALQKEKMEKEKKSVRSVWTDKQSERKKQNTRNGEKKKKNEAIQTWQFEEVLWWFQATSRGGWGNHISNVPVYLDEEGPGWVSGRGRADFFLVLLFVTLLKMYMGITSKLVNRKKKERNPLAIFLRSPLHSALRRVHATYETPLSPHVHCLAYYRNFCNAFLYFFF